MKGEEGEKQWSKEGLAEAIRKAVLARAPDFKVQASSLTFEGARRVIEQDLCMKPLSLDAHKKFIKCCLEEYLSADGGEKAPEPSGNSKSKAEKSTIEEPEEAQNTSEQKNAGAATFDETQASDGGTLNEANGVSKDMIREALKERAPFFKQHSETITFMKMRRLLEEDLNLTVKTLDPYKKFINTELDKALASLEKDKLENGVQNKTKKASKKVEKAEKPGTSKRTREESDSSNKEEEHSEEVKPKRRKQTVSKVKAKASTKNSSSQKNSVEEKKKSIASRSKKVAKEEREDNAIEENKGGSPIDKNESGSSDEEDVAEKKREQPVQVYGKKVEHLKSIIKSCGVSIPPAVYRRAKQAPEDRREAFLIKELEEILEKEGLSANSSEKEIKEVRRRKERAKELEGIDMSNIITSSRRSSAFSYIPPPRPPKIELSSDDDDDDDDDEDDDGDDDDDDVDLEKGDLNGDYDDGDGDDSEDHGTDEGNDNDDNKGKEADKDGGDKNN